MNFAVNIDVNICDRRQVVNFDVNIDVNIDDRWRPFRATIEISLADLAFTSMCFYIIDDSKWVLLKHPVEDSQGSCYK